MLTWLRNFLHRLKRANYLLGLALMKLIGGCACLGCGIWFLAFVALIIYAAYNGQSLHDFMGF